MICCWQPGAMPQAGIGCAVGAQECGLGEAAWGSAGGAQHCVRGWRCDSGSSESLRLDCAERARWERGAAPAGACGKRSGSVRLRETAGFEGEGLVDKVVGGMHDAGDHEAASS